MSRALRQPPGEMLGFWGDKGVGKPASGEAGRAWDAVPRDKPCWGNPGELRGGSGQGRAGNQR